MVLISLYRAWVAIPTNQNKLSISNGLSKLLRHMSDSRRQPRTSLRGNITYHSLTGGNVSSDESLVVVINAELFYYIPCSSESAHSTSCKNV